MMDVGSQSFIALLLYPQNYPGITVDTYNAEFQSKDVLDFILTLPCLGGIAEECACEAV